MIKWLGLLLGGLIGYSISLTAFGVGSVLGYLLGHFLGVWLESETNPLTQHRRRLQGDPEAYRHLLQQSTFLLMGYLAKSDGRVSEKEIATAERIFDAYGLDESGRKEAIRLFNSGKQPEFQLETMLEPLSSVARSHRDLIRVFLEVQAEIVLADGSVSSVKQKSFSFLSQKLGFSARAAKTMLHLVSARNHRQKNKGSLASLEDAYQVFQLSPGCSDKELKTAYRKAMSEHHPDKLMSEGATEQMVQAATEQTQTIQTAYQQIVNARKNR